MLWTLFVVLSALWLVGVATAYTFNGFIHLLLFIALIALVAQLITAAVANLLRARHLI